MNLINNSDRPLSNDLAELVQKVETEQDIKLANEAIVTEINEMGLATINVEYKGSIEIEDVSTNPIGLPRLYGSSLGEVSLVSFSDTELTLRVYDRA